jgi:hypothetical protein
MLDISIYNPNKINDSILSDDVLQSIGNKILKFVDSGNIPVKREIRHIKKHIKYIDGKCKQHMRLLDEGEHQIQILSNKISEALNKNSVLLANIKEDQD